MAASSTAWPLRPSPRSCGARRRGLLWTRRPLPLLALLLPLLLQVLLDCSWPLLADAATPRGRKVAPRRWSVLVLGGTGFRGHPTLEALLQLGHNVTVLSRGNPYWDVLPKLQKRGLNHFKCNRTMEVDSAAGALSDTTGLANCSQLVNSTTFFDAVVDFSSKEPGDMKQAVKFLKGRVGIYIYVSRHIVYDVAKNASHGGRYLLESDAARPGKEVSPLERFQLKSKHPASDDYLECEEELMRQFNAGGFPFTVLRVANAFGPKENTIRFWLLHLWIRANVALRLPMHVDTSLEETPISMTYTHDIAQAVVKVIEKSRGEVCCAEDVQGEAFNLACEEMPNQRTLYNYIAEPLGISYVETVEVEHNKSIVLYPEIVRGPISPTKALEQLRWAPTDLQKALRSVARFYDRVMLDASRFKFERETMYTKCTRMLGPDGERFVSWTRAFYDERRKTELYDELDDEDEDEIVLARRPPRRRRRRSGKRSDTEL